MTAVGMSQGLIPVIQNGHEDAAIELLSLGGVKLKVTDASGASLLHHAAQQRMALLVHTLVTEKNFNVMVKDSKGRTPLHYVQTLDGKVDKICRNIIRDLYVSSLNVHFSGSTEDNFKDSGGDLPCKVVFMYWQCLKNYPLENVDIEYSQQLMNWIGRSSSTGVANGGSNKQLS